MFKTADGHTVTRAQIAEVFGYRNTQSGRVADVRLTGASLPVSIILDQHPADVAYDLEAAPLAEQVAEEVKRDMEWVGSTEETHLPHMQGKDLVWQGVTFDMEAIGANIKANSAKYQAKFKADQAEAARRHEEGKERARKSVGRNLP